MKKILYAGTGTLLAIALLAIAMLSVKRAVAENSTEQGNLGESGVQMENATGTTVTSNSGENQSNAQDESVTAGQSAEGENNSSRNGISSEAVALDANGGFKVSGATVNSVDAASNSINATLYGFGKTVNVSGATIMGGNTRISLSDIQAGDKLSATGVYDETTHGIAVSTINDVSYAQKNNANIQSQIDHLLQLVQQLQQQLQSIQSQH